MADGNVFFLVFPAFSLFLLKTVFYNAPLGSTVALGLELYTRTPSAITGMRGAAGGRTPAAAKPPLCDVYCTHT